MRKRILWIEDSAFDENRYLATPVFLAGKYDLVVALTASEGVAQLRKATYDAIVVDIRIMPGEDPDWIQAFMAAGQRKESARLGLKLLYKVLDNGGGSCLAQRERVGVLTVERFDELKEHLGTMGVQVYRQKQGLANKNILLEVIREILAKHG